MYELYKEAESSFPLADYGLLMREVKRTGAKTALEIGPGASTLALIEAGLEKIVTLEHEEEWYEKAIERFKEYPQVTVGRYKDEPVVTADEIANQEFDIAFVDSPKGFTWPVPGVKGTRKKHPGMEDCSRLNTCLFALERAPIVFLHDAHRPLERGTLGRLSALGHSSWIFEAGSSLARIDRNGKRPSGVGLQGAA